MLPSLLNNQQRVTVTPPPPPILIDRGPTSGPVYVIRVFPVVM